MAKEVKLKIVKSKPITKKPEIKESQKTIEELDVVNKTIDIKSEYDYVDNDFERDIRKIINQVKDKNASLQNTNYMKIIHYLNEIINIIEKGV